MDDRWERDEPDEQPDGVGPPVDGPAWIGDEPPRPSPGGWRRWWWLVLLGAVPWLLVWLLTGGPGTGPGAPTATTSRGPSDTGTDTGRPSGGATPTERITGRATGTEPVPAGGPTPGATPPVGTVLGSGARTTPGLGDATALAHVVARAWLSGVGPELGVDGIEPVTDAWVADLAPAGIDHPAPGAVVVTLTAVLLHREDGRYTTASLRRVAVPIRLDGDGARPAGMPWWLPAPEVTPTEPETRPVEDPELLAEAGRALRAAGYTAVEINELAATDGWPAVVTARAVAPGRDRPRRHRLWLRRHLDRLTVAGALPTEAPTPSPAATRASPSPGGATR